MCFLTCADPVLMSLKEGYKKPSNLVFKAPVKEKRSVVVNGIDLLENVPPRTENEVGVTCSDYSTSCTHAQSETNDSASYTWLYQTKSPTL